VIAPFKNWRLWVAEGYVVAALVITAAIAIATYFYLKAELEGVVRDREVDCYREQAQLIRDGELPSELWEAGDYLVARGRLGRGSWGYEPVNRESVLVWYREPRQEKARIATVAKFEYAFWRGRYAAFVGLALVSILLLALLSVRHFRAFMKERDDFIAAVAHDLRTPLAMLSLQSMSASEDLQQAVARLRNLVGNLTEFLKLGGRRPAPKRERVELVALFHEAYGYFREGYEDVDCQVSAEGPSALFAEADSDLVLQIFWNLLGNDLKYAAAEGPIAVRFSSCDGCVTVAFADAGPGMSRRAMRKCFDRYYRATTIAASGKGGFGIGLCNAREFAQAMRGSLKVRANSPHGCIFTLTLPQSA